MNYNGMVKLKRKSRKPAYLSEAFIHENLSLKSSYIFLSSIQIVIKHTVPCNFLESCRSNHCFVWTNFTNSSCNSIQQTIVNIINAGLVLEHITF